MRPYRNRKISELEALFDTHRDDPSACDHIARELKLRKETQRVTDLHRRVVQRIAVGFRVDIAETPVAKETIHPDPAPAKPRNRFCQWVRNWFGY